METPPLNLPPASALSDQEIVDAIGEAAAMRKYWQAREVQLAGEMEARSVGRPVADSLAHRLGCRGCVEALQYLTGDSARAVRANMKLGKQIRPQVSLSGEELPAKFDTVADAMVSGKLGIESATLITGMLARVSRRASVADMERAEEDLVGSAIGLDPDSGAPTGIALHADNIRVMCRAWEQALDPDGAIPSEAELARRRAVRLGEVRDGLVPITGMLLPEVAAMLARTFDALGSPRTKENQEPVTLLQERTPDQKRHDMFATVVEVAAGSDAMPILGGAPITVLMQVKEETLESGVGIGWLHGPFGKKVPVGAATVRHAACSGAVQRVIQNPQGKVTALGTPERIFNAHQRRAIAVRDGGCVVPGCTIPSSWCEIHHVDPHARGGPTHTDNGVMLCFYHHRTIDTSGWHVKMIDGVPYVRAPGWLDYDQRWRPARSNRDLELTG